MDERIESLLARSFERARAVDANAQIDRMRRAHAVGDREAVSYEIVLPSSGGEQHLIEKVLPRLVYFLDCRGSKLPDAAGVFLSIFAGDALHFLHARDLIQVLAEWTGIAPAEMVRRWGAQSV